VKVLGLDGGHSQWVGVILESQEVAAFVWDLELEGSLLKEFDVVCIDTPIGLLDGERAAEKEARTFLKGQSSSVFSAPCRSALGRSYPDANSENKRVTGRGLSVQSHGIFRYIHAVDKLLASETCLRSTVIEGHPEITFRVLAGAMLPAKKTAEGIQARTATINSFFGADSVTVLQRSLPQKFLPDLLDAAAMAITASFHCQGLTSSFPTTPEVDEIGIMAAIWFPGQSSCLTASQTFR
jgi:predicted RNase H-like nuclease